VSVDVYLGTDDESAAARVFAAVDTLSALVGLMPPMAEEIHRGSFFRRVRTMARRGVTSQEVTSRLTKLERAIELAHVDARQADVDFKEAQAVAELLASLADVPQACVRIGSIFVVKYAGNSGPVILCRNLSQLELRAIERYPEIQREPGCAFDALATAISTLQCDAEDAHQ
jgi:hypothetical protein